MNKMLKNWLQIEKVMLKTKTIRITEVYGNDLFDFI